MANRLNPRPAAFRPAQCRLFPGLAAPDPAFHALGQPVHGTLGFAPKHTRYHRNRNSEFEDDGRIAKSAII